MSKETAATVDVEALIEEQLAIENDLAALEVVQSRIKFVKPAHFGPITPVLSVAAFINFGQTYQKILSCRNVGTNRAEHSMTVLFVTP